MKCLLHRLALLFAFVSVAGTSSRCLASEVSIRKIASANKLVAFSENSFGNKNANFSFQADSRTFRYNGTLMPLGFPATKHHGRIYIDTSDYAIHIKPLLPMVRHIYKKIKTVAIDAGHGGEDFGTVSATGSLKEKFLTMDVCLRIARLLRDRGYRVVLTRNEDKKIALEERTRICNNASADLFICVHFNSAPSKGANGIETFVLTPSTQVSSYQKSAHAQKSTFLGNQFDALNIVLGYHLQTSLINGTSSLDRGVKHGNFVVLRELKCPGALIECGFLSNASESARIASVEYREKLARAICNGIITFDNSLQH